MVVTSGLLDVKEKTFFTLFEYLLMRKLLQLLREIFFLLFIAKLLLYTEGGMNLLGPLIGQSLGNTAKPSVISSFAFSPLSFLSIE